MNLLGHAAVAVAWSSLTHRSPRRTGILWNYDFTNCVCYELQISVKRYLYVLCLIPYQYALSGSVNVDTAIQTDRTFHWRLILPSSVSIRNRVLINTTVELKALFRCSFYGMILWLLISKCNFTATLRKRNLTTTDFLLLCCVVSHVWWCD